MIDLWALTASADRLSPDARKALASEMNDWIAEQHASGIVLTTCHRAELYVFDRPPRLGGKARLLRGESAVSHLLRVACGLQSVIVGEDEVLHQVRDALRRASQSQSLDRRLHRLFETAIAAGRQARSRRTETSGNLAQKAVEWLRGKADISRRAVVIAGAGRMGSALAHAADLAGGEIVIASRDVERALRLAARYGGAGVDLPTAALLVHRAAEVDVALAGSWSSLEQAVSDRLPPIADISAPQAIPDTVRRRLQGGFLGIDDLYRRREPVPGAYRNDAERLVARKTADYMTWVERAA